MLYKSMTSLAAALVLFGMVGTANANLFGDTVVGCNISPVGDLTSVDAASCRLS